METELARQDKARVPAEAWELAEAEEEWEAAVLEQDLPATAYVLIVVPKYPIRGESHVIT